MEHMALKCLKAGADQIYKDKFCIYLSMSIRISTIIQEEIISSIATTMYLQ
jgi:hypothetical protein